MDEQKPNLTPTGPGWWYHRNQGILRVSIGVGGELFAHVGDYLSCTDVPVGDIDPDLWRGPVPEHGKWAPRELFDDMRSMLERIRPAPGTPADRVLAMANEWNQANPKPDETGHQRDFAFRVDHDGSGGYVVTDLPPMKPTGEWYSFTLDRETGEMGPISPVNALPTDEAPICGVCGGIGWDDVNHRNCPACDGTGRTEAPR